MIAASLRLRKRADYQRVYKASRKQFARRLSYFFMLRPPLGPKESPDGICARGLSPDSHSGFDCDAPRIGLTVGKAMGKAVDRNRIKRRMREAVRRQLPLLRMPVDVVLHPRPGVIDLDFTTLEREVASVFRVIQRASQPHPASTPAAID